MRKNLHQGTSKRKRDHIEIILNRNASFRGKSSGFENYEFEHNALPEINEKEIDTSIEFLGKQLNFPLMVSSMTGGFSKAKYINKILASVCEERKIAIGVGSQRQIFENSKFLDSYSIVRKYAPSIPVISNIGAAEIANIKLISNIERLIDCINADALAIHLNPLQEYLQLEGNSNFKGVLNGIEIIVKKLNVPVIVKEIGCGISASVAKRLINVGVNIIDVAGAGGTSWAGIEIMRSNQPNLSQAFWDWGIPTADSINMLSKLKKDLFIIGSGGVRNGVHIAKSIALGAQMAAAAAPFIEALNRGRETGINKLLDVWEKELRGVMFLTASKNIKELKKVKLHKRI